MMNGWKEVRFGDITDLIKRGIAPKYVEEGGYIVINQKCIRDGVLSFGDSRLTSKEKKVANEKFVQVGDVLINSTGTGTLGRTAPVRKLPGTATVDTHVTILRGNNKVDKLFLGYLASHCEPLITLLGKGATNQIELGASDLRVTKVVIPESKETQRKIASILSAYDDLIENNLKSIKLLKEKAQLTYEEWFVRMKFPGYENASINEETGLPEGWDKMLLGKFTKILKGKNITKSTRREGNVPVVAGGLSPAYYHDTPNTKNPVITASASGANAGFTNMYLEDVWASDCSYIDSTMCDYLFFVYALMIHNQPKIYHFQKGAAQPHVYPKDLVRLEAVIPTEDLLIKFNINSMNIFDSVRLLTKQNQFLKEARDILLPRLMTGMIDVEQMNIETLQPNTA
jgi:type I restriction enzyme, S subunit